MEFVELLSFFQDDPEAVGIAGAREPCLDGFVGPGPLRERKKKKRASFLFSFPGWGI